MNNSQRPKKRIAIVGAGPSGLFTLKRLLESEERDFAVDIYEAKSQLGSGMPYSELGASSEHITNVSGNEIPELETSVLEWIEQQPEEGLNNFNCKNGEFNDYKVMPRLLFGKYLAAQFELLLKKASECGIEVNVHLDTLVGDVIDCPSGNNISLSIEGGDNKEFEHVIVATGHVWPRTHEGKVPGYFDSPYPPKKLAMRLNHNVAVRGSSLTAIDGIRTMARSNGRFIEGEDGKLRFEANADSQDFRITMHSRQGLLPSIRFHLEDPHLSKEFIMSQDELERHKQENQGFISLDYVFQRDFRDLFAEKDPEFYDFIKHMSIEEFVDAMLKKRVEADPYLFFKFEYEEAEKSIRERQSVHWKEMLAVLSFAMNYPAKHFSAEDMHRLQKVLMPLISIVIAFVPQSSCRELFALFDADRLEIISVGDDSRVEVNASAGIEVIYGDDLGNERKTVYHTFVDCIGQKHLSFKDFPFKSLTSNASVAPARLKFRDMKNAEKLSAADKEKLFKGADGLYYLTLPGLAINDAFEALNEKGEANPRLFLMAVPFLGGHNPDYSGLDFCEEASKRIVNRIFQAPINEGE